MRPTPFVLALLPVLFGAGFPKVVRVRVPTEAVSTYFPPGTQMRGLAREEFEALVAAAREGHARRQRDGGPRLIRARHAVRWEAGRLLGRSELLVEAGGGAAGRLALEPWTPAIDPEASAPAEVLNRPDGTTALRVPAAAGTTTVTPAWELRARPGSDGHVFALGLPRLDAAALVLDLPEGWIPEGPAGIRRGPLPGSGPDRRSWRFDGPGGATSLRLRAAPGRGEPTPAATTWVGGPIRIDVGEASAQWQAVWSVEPGPGALRRLAVRLDPGLEVLEASGPDVLGFQAEPDGAGTRLTVRLADGPAGRTEVTISALARVPAEGPWTVPAARPLEATWTGGKTVLRLGPTRVLEGCRERAGRRVVPRLEETGEASLGGPILAFEAAAPLPVAELTFRRVGPEATAEIRGQLRLGGECLRIEALVSWRWKAERGRVLGFAAELAPGWVPERVQAADGKDTIPWQAEPDSGGKTRVHIRPPPAADAGGVLALILTATAPLPAGAGAFALPRVRPVGVPTTDELWVTRIEPGTPVVPPTVRPLEARGLAWIDPASLPPDAAGTAGNLGWRWTAADGQARACLRRAATPPAGSIQQVALIDPDRLTLRWRVALRPGDEPIRTVAVAANESLPEAPRWHLAGEEDGPPLASRPLDAPGQAAWGLPVGGSAWEIDLPTAHRGHLDLLGRLERPWGAGGPIPLLALPERFRARGTVLVLVDRGTRSAAQAAGLHALEPSLAGEALARDVLPDRPDDPAPDPAGYRRAHVFGYQGAPGRLDVRTEALVPAGDDGVIREALLRTRAVPGGPAQHRLTLDVVSTGARRLSVDLPAEATLQRAEGDGRPVVPIREGPSLHFLLPDPGTTGPTSTLVLDYQTPPGSTAGVRPERPRFSLPCLSLGWEIGVPGPWEVTAASPALIGTDPEPSPSWAARIPGRGPRAPATGSAAAMLRELDARERLGAAATTLGERLLSWELGRWPVVVDRWALAAAGVGPGTEMEAPAPTASARDGPARAVLGPLGLTVVALEDVLLVTSQAEEPGRAGGSLRRRPGAEAWNRAARQAVAWGADATDRFQAVVRWRGEPTPQGPSGSEATGGTPGTAGWSLRRFQVAGAPATGGAVVLADAWSRAVGGGGVALAILILGLAAWDLPRRRLGRALVALLIVAALAVSWAWSDGPTQVLGALGGALIVLAIGLARALRSRLRRRRERRRRPASSIRSRHSAARIATVLVVGAASMRSAASPTADPAAGPSPAEGVILALIPYANLAELAGRDQRVLLRLEDHERLRAWAAAQRPDPRPEGSIAATAARHRVRLDAEGDAIVESRYELRVDGAGARSWDVPVGEARDLAATLDGRGVPILIRPGGWTAVVAVAGAGRHDLVVRRSLPPRLTETGQVLRLPISPMATARAEVERPAPGLSIELPGARGPVAAAGATIEAELGPVDLLEVHWMPRAQADRSGRLEAVEGLLLWDVEPAGDRLRARWTVRNPGGADRFRLGLDPGLVVRSAAIPAPGVVDAGWLGSASAPEWVARFDPPLPDGATLTVELWRPAAAGGPEGADRSTARLPRVEPLGVGRSAGLMGFRRPADWSGRLGAIPGTEAIADEAFARAWGGLPREPLTLAGSSRFSGVPTAAVATGPVPPRPAIRPAVGLEVAPGRVGVRIDAELVDRGGRTFEVVAVLPERLVLTRVEADGLTDWSRPARDRLSLRFDGADAAPRRAIRLEGWLPVPADPLAPDDLRRELGVPWPRWPGAEEEPGLLTIAGAALAQITSREPAGVVKLPPGDATAPGRLAYRVERPEALNRLSWTAEPPRVDVAVRSWVRIDPGSAQWTARVDYQVSGGAIDAIRLKLPDAWAAVARAEVLGGGHRLAAEAAGEATGWTIRPAEPVWGGCTILIHADRPLPEAEPLEFPDLVPLGRGTVETYLALVDASGRPLEVEGTRGIEPVDDSRFPPEDDEGPGLSRRVYRVRHEGWSLRIRAGGGPAAPGAEEARVVLADVACVLAGDGSAWGEASLDVEPRTGAFVGLDLPAESQAVAATVGGQPARPLRATSGRWLVPLGDGVSGRVVVVWRSDRAASGPAGDRVVPLPGLTRARVPLLVTVHAPDSWRIEVAAGAAHPAPAEALEAARAEALRTRIVATLDDVDRASARDRRALIAALAGFEIRARQAERRARWAPTVRFPAAPEAQRPVLQRLEEMRSLLAEDLRLAGFDALAAESRARLGLAGSDPGEGLIIPSEPPAPLRVRRLGRPRHFSGQTDAQGAPPTLRVVPPASS